MARIHKTYKQRHAGMDRSYISQNILNAFRKPYFFLKINSQGQKGKVKLLSLIFPWCFIYYIKSFFTGFKYKVAPVASKSQTELKNLLQQHLYWNNSPEYCINGFNFIKQKHNITLGVLFNETEQRGNPRLRNREPCPFLNLLWKDSRKSTFQRFFMGTQSPMFNHSQPYRMSKSVLTVTKG